MPDKPSKPLQIGVFPKAGGFRAEVEPLPKSKADAELRIANRFTAALKVRFGRELGPCGLGGEWPDVLTSENGRPIGIELAEVVNPAHVKHGGYGKPQWVEEHIPHRLLLNTIKAKVGKKYSPVRDMSVWLLVYDLTLSVAFEHALAKRVAHGWLLNQSHPFSEIWYMLPLPEATSFPSLLESVWPSTEFTSTASP